MSASKSNLTASSAIVRAILEADEDFDIKGIEATDPTGGKAKVERHGRWKLVRMEDYTFLISYLTPVAFYDKVQNKFYRTSKWWSSTTEQHIRDWETMIWKSPEWKNDPANQEKSEYGGGYFAKYPRFEKMPQKAVTGLFLKLMKTMDMKPGEKRRLYHVDPQMRKGSTVARRWIGGHLKHHDTGDEGLPLTVGQAADADIPPEFFKDFRPSTPEFYEWGSDYGRRDNTPYEPDERGRRPKRED